MDVTFTYDHSGIRTGKRVNRNGAITEHSFYTQNGTIVGEARRNPNGTVDRLEFVYDEAGRPLQLIFNGRIYNYVLNLQGDVQQIRRSTDGVVVATYLYNAWGQLLQSSGVMAESNPLRYRGYFYDVATGLYYLQSRFYDPVIGRFINADATWVLGVEQNNLLQYNLFTYGLNNPVMFVDHDGYLAFLAIPLIVGAVKLAKKATVVTIAYNAAAGAYVGAVSGGISANVASRLRGDDPHTRRINTAAGIIAGAGAGLVTGVLTTPFGTVLSGVQVITAARAGSYTAVRVEIGRRLVTGVIRASITNQFNMIPNGVPTVSREIINRVTSQVAQQRTTATSSNTTQAARNHTNVLTQYLQ